MGRLGQGAGEDPTAPGTPTRVALLLAYVTWVPGPKTGQGGVWEQERVDGEFTQGKWDPEH